MEFTDENKQTILDLLKAGKRSAALQFISSEFRVSTGDADKLLAAFEGQFMKAGQSNQTASTSISGCVGCFSGLLKGISIFIALIGIGILGVGYFIPEFINRAGSDMMVPTIVDSEYFPTSDSSNVRLIVKFNHQGIIVSDTTYTIYSRGMYFPGDSLRIDADLMV